MGSDSENGFTYVNHSLGHQSTIDHCIVSRDIFDLIVDNCIIYDPTNHSNHNVIQLTFTCIYEDIPVRTGSAPLHSDRLPSCAWDKATTAHIDNYICI